ncbi:XTP/dITP diphosphatase [candidate division TA06 bacterium]|uniref:dITP/XTP pyrophosphatase n=1 Tax=candidate division TA06 bacterium TaxID=2250710 RepID=A0A523UPA8_UNCT6|nr:MAG: XTP/dITP diphosphatase [candidate division TA06 bacterium]
MTLVLATRNTDKIREISFILRDLQVELRCLDDFPGAPQVEENGATFEENAAKKARSACAHSQEAALAEDSGLRVDWLKGAPGLLSSRFAGEDVSYQENNAKLLSALEGVALEKRTAAFVCVVAVCLPGRRVKTFRGTCKGVISLEPRGSSGFGYDPLFLVPEYGKTFAEIGEAIKNRISHRAIALNKAKVYFTRLLASEP